MALGGTCLLPHRHPLLMYWQGEMNGEKQQLGKVSAPLCKHHHTARFMTHFICQFYIRLQFFDAICVIIWQMINSPTTANSSGNVLREHLGRFVEKEKADCGLLIMLEYLFCAWEMFWNTLVCIEWAVLNLKKFTEIHLFEVYHLSSQSQGNVMKRYEYACVCRSRYD